MRLFAVLAITLLDTAVVVSDNFPASETEQANLAGNACTIIALRSGGFSELRVETFEGSVHDDKTSRDYIGCRVVGVGEGIAYRDENWPHDILRMKMLSDDWQEDISRAADGAGSTAFALGKGTALCLFSAIWIIKEPFEPEMIEATSYRFEVNCFEAVKPI